MKAQIQESSKSFSFSPKCTAETNISALFAPKLRLRTQRLSEGILWENLRLRPEAVFTYGERKRAVIEKEYNDGWKKANGFQP